MVEAPILHFQGHYGFLSNFHVSQMQWDGRIVLTAEHAFQSSKTDDPVWKMEILTAPTAARAKKYGRLAPKRDNWEQIRDLVMLSVLREKFSDPYLTKRLLDTGNRLLVEGNSWGDTYWGVCKGQGQNQLGKLLMAVRAEIRTRESGRSHG